jgi:hypothetical protein
VLVAPGRTWEGRTALATIPDTVRSRYQRTFHAVLQQVPEVSGDRARAETYCVARHLKAVPGATPFCYEMTIRYQDEFARTAAGWRFTRRELVVDWTQIYQVKPGFNVAGDQVR